MNKLITAVLVLSCTFSNAQIIKTKIHETGGNTESYQLSALDSISYDGLNINMTIYQTGGNIVDHPIANVDSITFVTATCPATLTDPRDEEVYPVLQIGDQCWMAENLRYDVPDIFGISDTINTLNPSLLYGRLYDWTTAMNDSASSTLNPSGVQGICPDGWHIPSDAEWNEMELALGMPLSGTTWIGYRGFHALSIKSVTGWSESILDGSDGNGTNQTGFNAFPAGRVLDSFFDDLSQYAIFLSATAPNSSLVWCREVNSGNTAVGRYGHPKYNAHSCRCVMD
jgi:uncharacterized protein (TIGR02145 family)